MKGHFLSFIILLFVSLIFHPAPLHADSKNYNATEDAVSALLIFEQSGFARCYGIFTHGLARIAYDDLNKNVNDLKFALLMNSFITSSPLLRGELFAHRAFAPDKEDEIGFEQSEPMHFENGVGKLKGQLIINNIRKDVVFEANLNKFARVNNSKDVFEDGAQTLGISIHTAFKRSDFGLSNENEPSSFNDETILMLDIIGKN